MRSLRLNDTKAHNVRVQNNIHIILQNANIEEKYTVSSVIDIMMFDRNIDLWPLHAVYPIVTDKSK